MKLTIIATSLLTLLATTTATILPRGGHGNGGGDDWSSKSPVPGYPRGNSHCLSDQQATFLVNTFKGMLTNTDRNGANKTAQILLAEGFVEESDSINILAGYPLGGPSFTGKQTYINGLIKAPPLPQMDVLEVFHDCTRIVWRWNIPHLARDVYPVKGIQILTVNDVKKGQIGKITLEFSSIAWGTDIGWTCTKPGGPPQ